MGVTRGGHERGAFTRRVHASIVVAAIWFVGCSGGDASTSPTPSDPAGSNGEVAAAPTNTAPATVAPASTAATTAPPTTPPPPTTQPPTTVAEPAWVTGGSEALFDDDTMHTFEFKVSEPDLAVLDEDPTAEEYVGAAMTFDGDKIGDVGLRYKGSVGAFMSCTDGGFQFDPDDGFRPSGKKSCRKLSMKVKINWDDKGRTFYGVRRLQLHSMANDPTLMHDRLGYWLFREMGVPAPRSTHAKVVVNGTLVGVFALVENVDGRFTQEHFEHGKGNLYSDVWPLWPGAKVRTEEELIKQLETNEDEDPSAELTMAFGREVLAAAPQDRLAVVKKWMDVDAFLRYAVVDRAIKHEDGALHWYTAGGALNGPHNFFWYEDPTAKRMTVIPWDLDLAFAALGEGGFANLIPIGDEFGTTRNDCKPYPLGTFNLPQISAACDPIVAALASMTDEYDAIRAELLAGPFSAERIGEMLDKWTRQIEPALIEENEVHGDRPLDAWKTAVDALERSLDRSRTGSGR